MGLFGKLFGGRYYPSLRKDSPAAEHLRELQGTLEEVLDTTAERVEVIPGQGRAFVFVGTPPASFGLLWIEDGRVRGLNNFVAEHGLDLPRENGLIAALVQAYARSGDAPRYRTRLAGREVLVTPSASLALEVEKILERGARA